MEIVNGSSVKESKLCSIEARAVWGPGVVVKLVVEQSPSFYVTWGALSGFRPVMLRRGKGPGWGVDCGSI